MLLPITTTVVTAQCHIEGLKFNKNTKKKKQWSNAFLSLFLWVLFAVWRGLLIGIFFRRAKEMARS